MISNIYDFYEVIKCQIFISDNNLGIWPLQHLQIQDGCC